MHWCLACFNGQNVIFLYTFIRSIIVENLMYVIEHWANTTSGVANRQFFCLQTTEELSWSTSYLQATQQCRCIVWQVLLLSMILYHPIQRSCQSRRPALERLLFLCSSLLGVCLLATRRLKDRFTLLVFEKLFADSCLTRSSSFFLAYWTFPPL